MSPVRWAPVPKRRAHEAETAPTFGLSGNPASTRAAVRWGGGGVVPVTGSRHDVWTNSPSQIWAAGPVLGYHMFAAIEGGPDVMSLDLESLQCPCE